jgi:hypothetical protein
VAEPSRNDTLEPGEIRFVDNYLPLLEAGHYTITVTQSLEGSGAYQADRWFAETQDFAVSGPRFRLDPSDIHAVFPPKNSQGIFGHDLPHIVLTKRALPWERSLFDDKTIPWMALLLFDASEILTPCVGSNAVGEAPNPTGVTTIRVEDLLAPERGAMIGDYNRDSLDENEMLQSCQVIDITPEMFKAVVPSGDDVRYLAHCREVNLAPKAVAGPARPGAEVAPGNGSAWVSVVVGGRFPGLAAPGQAGGVNVAHLVSLEGFEAYLDEPGQAAFPPGTERVRLVSLASWTFTCLPERGESFSGLMSGLVAGDRKGALEFRLPAQQPGPAATPEEVFAFRVLEAGYVPCSYQTRQGEQTFAWYRGPFTPQPVARFAADRAPFLTSAQAMVYDQDHGLFDCSYAVAWETGRLLALSDQRFGVDLLHLRRKTGRLIDWLPEQSVCSSPQGDPVMASEPQRFRALPQKNTTSDAFMSHLLGPFATRIEPQIFKPSGKVPAEPAPELMVMAPGPGAAAPDQSGGVEQVLMEAGGEELDPICEWLAHLYLLYGVPFNNLVADERLLPPESIRFFYLDRNWLEVMLDGALSIGIQSSKDTRCQQALYGLVRDRVLERIHAMRDKLLGNGGPASGEMGEGPPAGLLLRSAVVSGWPGLEVRAYSESSGQAGSGPVALLRMDRPSEDVLLCLFAQVPAWIEFDEPKEGLHFGVTVDEGTEKIGLRHLSGPEAGTWCGEMEMPGRDERRRLDIRALLAEMASGLGACAGGDLGPAAFALQMVKVPEQMVFQTMSEPAE